MRPSTKALPAPQPFVYHNDQNWYADRRQRKFHCFVTGDSLCGKYRLRPGLEWDDFHRTRAIPARQRCMPCDRLLRKRVR